MCSPLHSHLPSPPTTSALCTAAAAAATAALHHNTHTPTFAQSTSLTTTVAPPPSLCRLFQPSASQSWEIWLFFMGTWQHCCSSAGQRTADSGACCAISCLVFFGRCGCPEKLVCSLAGAVRDRRTSVCAIRPRASASHARTHRHTHAHALMQAYRQALDWVICQTLVCCNNTNNTAHVFSH